MVKPKRLHVARSMVDLHSQVFVPRKFGELLTLQLLRVRYEAEKKEADRYLSEDGDQELAYLGYCSALEYLKMMSDCKEYRQQDIQTRWDQEKAECEQLECALRLQLEDRYEDMEFIDDGQAESDDGRSYSKPQWNYAMDTRVQYASSELSRSTSSVNQHEKQQTNSTFNYSPRQHRSTVSRHSSLRQSELFKPRTVSRPVFERSLASEIVLPQTSSIGLLALPRVKPLTRECVVCCLEKPVADFSEIVSSACRHTQRQICHDCIRENTRNMVNELSTTTILCPEQGCGASLDFSTVRSLVLNLNTIQGRSKAAVDRYENKLSMEYVEKMEDFLWCAHGCGHGVQLADDQTICYECTSCKQKTCVQHRARWHFGLTCLEYDQQLKSDQEEQENQSWMRTHTKTCPKCKAPIEKNEGCDHMTCRHCKHDFCWICLADYSPVRRRGGQLHEPQCIYYRKAKNIE